MTTTTPPTTPLVPNHHADQPGFQGVSGLVAAIGFNIGRDGDAELAVRLAGVTAGDDVVDIGCGPGVGGGAPPPLVRHRSSASTRRP
jgi:hypothetical protein